MMLRSISFYTPKISANMNDHSKYNPTMRSIFVTGLFQIIGGAVLAFSAIILVAASYDDTFRNRFDYPVSGLWSGAWVMIVGSIGVLASSRPGAMRIAYMVCAILTVPPLIVATVLAAVAAADNLHYYLDHPGYFDDTNDYGYGPQHELSLTKLVFHILVGFVGCSELTIALLASVFCCNGFCPGNKTTALIKNNNDFAQDLPPPDDHSYVYPPPTVAMETISPDIDNDKV